MADQQVVISVLADVSRFSKNMRSLGSRFVSFGKAALLATAAIGLGLAKLGFDMVKLAEESAQADARLNNIAESMGIFGKRAGEVSKRLQAFADTQSMITGTDDELIKNTQAKLLTFKDLAKSADIAGGAFDRATVAALDMAAAGFGSATSNAVQLGKALNNPIKGIGALTRSGITFTDKEKEKITRLVESNKTLEAQEYILSAIETQVGGTAEATATATQKMQVAFEGIGEEIGSVLLPYIGEMAEAFLAWLQDDETIAFFDDVKKGIGNFIDAMKDAFNDPAVKETFDRLNNGMKKFFEYLSSPKGRKDLQTFARNIASAFAVVNETLTFTLFGLNAIMSALSGNWGALNMTYDQFKNKYFPSYGGGGGGSNPSTNNNTARTKSMTSTPSVVVNFNTPIDSVSAGREIVRAVDNYNRTRGKVFA
jgi:hypothetical protein